MRQAILRRAVELEICQCCGAELFAADAEGLEGAGGVVEWDREMFLALGDESFGLEVAFASLAGDQASSSKLGKRK